MADHVREAINAAKTYSEKVRRETKLKTTTVSETKIQPEKVRRETLSALTAVCFFRRTENLCRIAPKRNIDAVCPAILLTTQGTFLNLNRYGEGLSRKLHSMLKRYGGEYSRKLHSMLKNYGER